MAIQLLTLELVLGALLIGGIAAYGRNLAERICLFAAVPISFLLSFLLAKFGVWDFAGETVVSVLMTETELADLLGGSMATATGLEAILVSFARPFLVVVVFWVLMLFFRIVVAIVFHKKNKAARLAAKAEKRAIKEAKRAARAAAKNGENTPVEMPERTPAGRKWAPVAFGALGTLAACLLSFLPVTFLANLAMPAVERAEQPEYAETYVQETVLAVDESILSRFDGTAYTYASRFTGVHAILVAASESLSDVTLTGNDGEVIAFNTTELVQHLLCDGVDAMAVYEYSYSPDNYTVGDLRPIADILADLAETPALLKIVTELVETMELGGGEETEGEGGIADGFLDILLKSYHSDDITTLSGDLTALSALVDLLADELADCTLEGDALTPAVIGFISDEAAAGKLITVLSQMSSYTDAIAIFSEYGVNMLCDFLEISEDKDAFYEDYLAALLTAVNDRTEGEYDPTEVESFIKTAAKKEINVLNYTVEDSDRLSSLDFSFINYKRYITRAQATEQVFSDFRLAFTGVTWFGASDGTVYYLDEGKPGEAYWRVADAETELSASSLIAAVLVARSTEIFADDMGAEITADMLRDWCRTLEPAIGALYPDATAEMKAQAQALADGILDFERFAPDTVFRADIFATVKTDLPATEAQNEAFGAVLATAGQLFTGLLGQEEVDLTTVVDNFGLMGRLLDKLHALDITSEIPAAMLRALSENKNFSAYIATETVPELIDNMDKGLSTYEELFSTIQGYYGMAGGLLGM